MYALLLVGVFLSCLAGCGGGGDPIPPFWVENGIATADFNADGLADIALVRTYVAGPPPHAGSVAIYLQTADHQFTRPVSYAVGSDPWNLAVGDLNNDQRPDLVVANSRSGNLSLLIQAGNPGSFLPALAVTTGGTPYAIAISDIDADGHADLAVALQNSGGGALVLLQDPAAPLAFRTPISLTNGTGATAIALGDLNHDGRPDLAINGAAALLFFQEADGSFAPGGALAVGIRPTSVGIADLDNDSYADLFVTSAGSSTDGSGASLSILLHNPQNPGTFFPALNVPVANGARQSAVGQLTGDPAPDIALISLVFSAQQPATLSVLQNQGAGHFGIAQTLVGSFSADFIASADLNADGLLDLIVNDGPRVFMQRTSAPGSFAAGEPLPLAP